MGHTVCKLPAQRSIKARSSIENEKLSPGPERGSAHGSHTQTENPHPLCRFGVAGSDSPARRPKRPTYERANASHGFAVGALSSRPPRRRIVILRKVTDIDAKRMKKTKKHSSTARMAPTHTFPREILKSRNPGPRDLGRTATRLTCGALSLCCSTVQQIPAAERSPRGSALRRRRPQLPCIRVCV